MRSSSRHPRVCRNALLSVGALVVLGAVQARAQTTIPLASSTGGIAVNYNNNGGGENPLNQAYLRAQFSKTNTNGAELNFDTTPLPGGGGLTWYDMFQAVPDQFGLDIIVEAATSDGTNPTPVLNAFDNVDGTVANAYNAGSVTWGISDYKGPAASGPASPLNSIINSLFRGGVGDPGHRLNGIISPASTLDGSVTNLTIVLTKVGTVFTADISGELNTDGFIHWYAPGLGKSPIGNFALTGKFFFEGTFTYDSATDTNPLMDFYQGTTTISAEVICGDRFVDTATGNDTGNICTSALSPCKTIQHAVIAACPGDTVNVAAGTYEEQVRIDKSLNLVGAGAGSTTILAPPKASRATEDVDHGFGLRTYDYLVGVFGTGAETVNISGFTLDGNNDAKSSGPGTFRSQQLTFFNANGTIEDNVLIDWQDPAAFGAQGVATLVSGSLTPVTVNVLGNVIDGYQKGGIVALGTGAVAATIEGNTVAGAGPITTTAQNGIQISNGAGGSIIGNTVSDNNYRGSGWCSAGILVNGVDGITVQGNTLSGSLCDLLLITNNSTIEGNDIASALEWPFSILGNENTVHKNYVNGSTATYEGIYVDGSDNVLTCNRITNNDTGIFFDSYSTAGTPNGANQNTIVGNGTGIDGSLVLAPPDIDATNNWWGCAAGPGNPGCDTVTPNVDASSPAAGEPQCVTCAGAGGDTDGDEVCDPADNCPDDPNPGQEDTDGDGVGDACDPCPLDDPDDTDGDGLCNSDDACPLDPDNDADGDTVCGDVDNCPDDANPGQEDFDNDGLGNACDHDDVAGLSLRKVRTEKRGAGRDTYTVKAELDGTPTPTFVGDVDTGGITVVVETTTPPGELQAFTFSGNNCSVLGKNIKCRDPLTRSIIRLAARSATLFFKVEISVKRVTLMHQPTAAETPLVVRLQTADFIDRRDDIGGCAETTGGRALRCRELP